MRKSIEIRRYGEYSFRNQYGSLFLCQWPTFAPRIPSGPISVQVTATDKNPKRKGWVKVGIQDRGLYFKLTVKQATTTEHLLVQVYSSLRNFIYDLGPFEQRKFLWFKGEVING